MTAALNLTSITHSHPGAVQRTLAQVDLEVQDGEMVAVLGPSGSGKTTLLRIAAGLEQPESGDVLLDGMSVLGVPPERRDLTVMFQKPHLFPHLSVLDNVAFADRLRGRSRTQSRAAAQKYLDLVHLGDLARRRPRQLSGGQEQRVALARALAASRRVMLLDEPFSALDNNLRTSMHQLLGEVRAALDPTVVMVTHDLEEAGLADRVAVLVEGRIEQFDTVTSLYSAPKTLTVARLVGGFNELPGRVESGTHHSSLGCFTLPGGVWGDGPSTLLVRKETLGLTHPDQSPTVTGRVVQVRQSGPHQDVVVELDHPQGAARLRVDVQARLGTGLRAGDRTGVLFPSANGLWAVGGTDVDEPSRGSSVIDMPTAFGGATAASAEARSVVPRAPLRGRR